MARGLDYEHVNCPLWSFEGAAKPAHIDKLSAVIAVGKHLFPFRTEKLSPPAPMVLGGQPPGRVGRRRILTEGAARAALFVFLGPYAERERALGDRAAVGNLDRAAQTLSRRVGRDAPRAANDVAASGVVDHAQLRTPGERGAADVHGRRGRSGDEQTRPRDQPAAGPRDPRRGARS